MSKAFERELETLRKALSDMAATVESMIVETIEALVMREGKNFGEIREKENRVNQMEMQIDDMAWKMIALRQPMGTDLRFILTCIKVNPLLERIADEAINILKKAEYLLTVPILKPLIDIPLMTEKVKWAFHSSIETLFNGDTFLARDICLSDSEIDEIRDRIYQDLMVYMKDSEDNVEKALKLLLIAKSLERIGDIATDIAEDAIYLYEGKDIRHHSESDEEFRRHSQKMKIKQQ